ncbi:MAG: hypothetical protein U1D55_05690 [Phycisphaerae bacterium]
MRARSSAFGWSLVTAFGICLSISGGCAEFGSVLQNTNSNTSGDSTSSIDSDRDGLTDAEEAQLGTNPRSSDTDSDGITDFDEVRTTQTDPLKADSDGDSVSDGAELRVGLDPLKANLVGSANQVICSSFLSVRELPTPKQSGVFAVHSGNSDFSRWRENDSVALNDAGDTLVNVTRNLSAPVTAVGQLVQTKRLATRANRGGTLRLEDGSLFTVSDEPSRTEALRWFTSDEIVVIQSSDDAPATLINLRLCESLTATRGV